VKSRLRSGLTLLDLIIIVLPLALAFMLLRQGGGTSPSVVRIITPGGVWRQALPAEKAIRLEGSLGMFEVHVSGGRVSIRETHCPDHVCQGMGPIEQNGQAMICVPQRIEVWLEGGEPEVDAVCR